MEKGYVLGLYEKAVPSALSMKEKLVAAREADYDYMELSIDETDEKLARLDWSRKEREELFCLCSREKLPLRSMCLSAHRRYPLGAEDEERSAQSLEIMRKAIYLAGDLGIRMIQLAGYDEYYRESNEATKQRFRENLFRATEMASEYGVMLGFETMETAFMDTCKKAMDYISAVNSPYLNIYPDIGNLTNAEKLYGTWALDDLSSARGHILALHLKETKPGIYREVPYGTGHVDFVQAVQIAWKLGVRAYTAEFWYTGGDWKKELSENNQYLRTFLDYTKQNKK